MIWSYGKRTWLLARWRGEKATVQVYRVMFGESVGGGTRAVRRVYELEASKVHIHLVLQMLRRQNKKVFFL